MPEENCLHCGKPIVDRKQLKFCNEVCRVKWNNNRKAEKKEPYDPFLALFTAIVIPDTKEAHKIVQFHNPHQLSNLGHKIIHKIEHKIDNEGGIVFMQQNTISFTFTTCSVTTSSI